MCTNICNTTIKWRWATDWDACMTSVWKSFAANSNTSPYLPTVLWRYSHRPDTWNIPTNRTMLHESSSRSAGMSYINSAKWVSLRRNWYRWSFAPTRVFLQITPTSANKRCRYAQDWPGSRFTTCWWCWASAVSSTTFRIKRHLTLYIRANG